MGPQLPYVAVRPGRPSILRLFVVALFASLAGCSTVSVLQSSQYLGVPPSPPTDPATVGILRSLPPQPITRLGEIVISPTGTPTVQEIEDRFRAVAAPWGAQAVVIVSDTAQPVGMVYSGDWWGGSAQQWWGRVIVGLAIRYQPVEPPK